MNNLATIVDTQQAVAEFQMNSRAKIESNRIKCSQTFANKKYCRDSYQNLNLPNSVQATKKPESRET